MRALWRILTRIIFWSYERGTWPYDLAVAGIVLFVLLSPRSWFHDQPQVTPPARAGQIEILSEDPAAHTHTYRVDADLLLAARPREQLTLDTHSLLRKVVAPLQDGRFEILRIDPVRGPDGAVLYYAVTVKK